MYATAEVSEHTRGGEMREASVLRAFRQAADTVPAYARILAEAGTQADEVRDLSSFQERVPVLDKASTFGRFALHELCAGGAVPPLAGVLTSSGHSGRFAFGAYSLGSAEAEATAIDEALDASLCVGSRRTLLINGLPMGVRVPTRTCTLAETSVRADMIIALVENFGRYYDQVILVGEAAFIKHTLELGSEKGVDWSDLLVHLLLGEESLAENARSYLAGILGCDGADRDSGLIASSMGVGEIGLNLFLEIPIWSGQPAGSLIRLRRALHQAPDVRRRVLGRDVPCMPMCMTYDPGRLFVEFLPDGSLVLTDLRPERTIPLPRYRTGDRGEFLSLSGEQRSILGEQAGTDADCLGGFPIVLIHGRGEGVRHGGRLVTPEEIKEGLYAKPSLAARVTGNFRISAGREAVRARIQLTPGTIPSRELDAEFGRILSRNAAAPVMATCEEHATFGHGMSLDYERKFAYVDRLDQGEDVADKDAQSGNGMGGPGTGIEE